MQLLTGWFNTNNMMKAIGSLGDTPYEREILRQIFIQYFSKFYKKENKKETHILVFIKHDEETFKMSRGSFQKALKSLQLRGIIISRGRLGSKGGHDISIITEPIVRSICHDIKAEIILNDDTPKGL